MNEVNPSLQCTTPPTRGPSEIRSWRSLGWIALTFAALLFAWPKPAAAHEGAALKAVIEIGDDGVCTLTVVVDAEHLRTDFGATAPWIEVAGVPADSGPARQSRGVAAGLALLFDGTPVSLRVSWLAPRRPPDLHLRLEGTIPPGSRDVALRNRLSIGDWLVSVRHAGRDDDVVRSYASDDVMPPVTIDATSVPPTTSAVIGQFVREGFVHILPEGLDHILFVLGLFLIATRAKPLLLQVTAFTLAHTTTLALSAGGVVTLPSAIVEPLIAVSIVYVAVENLLVREVGRARLALVFGFGLLHGLGFAGALADLGLPPASKAVALVSFNVGVELGQLTVLAVAWILLAWPFRAKPWYRARVVVPGSVLIALVGAYWAVTRTFGG